MTNQTETIVALAFFLAIPASTTALECPTNAEIPVLAEFEEPETTLLAVWADGRIVTSSHGVETWLRVEPKLVRWAVQQLAAPRTCEDHDGDGYRYFEIPPTVTRFVRDAPHLSCWYDEVLSGEARQGWWSAWVSEILTYAEPWVALPRCIVPSRLEVNVRARIRNAELPSME